MIIKFVNNRGRYLACSIILRTLTFDDLDFDQVTYFYIFKATGVKFAPHDDIDQ